MPRIYLTCLIFARKALLLIYVPIEASLFHKAIHNLCNNSSVQHFFSFPPFGFFCNQYTTWFYLCIFTLWFNNGVGSGIRTRTSSLVDSYAAIKHHAHMEPEKGLEPLTC